MSNLIDTLIEMGFPRHRAELAISNANSKDIEAVTEWLLTHEEETPPQQPPTENECVSKEEEEDKTTTASEEAAAAAEVEAELQLEAKSIKCDECGKLFNNQTEVEFHSAKSGHTTFSESTEEKKPLSEEERKEQLAKIEAKLKQRRLEREEREKQEALEREKKRIRSGKDLLEAKRKQDDMELKKIVEQRKREKEEDRLARQRVKDQIEQDKLARKAKFDQKVKPSSPTAVAPAPAIIPKPVTVSKPQQQYTDVKLQIRLTNGKSLTQTFGAKEPLSAVRLYIEMNRDDGTGPFTLMTSFPRKEFSGEDYEKPLDSLGLGMHFTGKPPTSENFHRNEKLIQNS